MELGLMPFRTTTVRLCLGFTWLQAGRRPVGIQCIPRRERSILGEMPEERGTPKMLQGYPDCHGRNMSSSSCLSLPREAGSSIVAEAGSKPGTFPSKRYLHHPSHHLCHQCQIVPPTPPHGSRKADCVAGTRGSRTADPGCQVLPHSSNHFSLHGCFRK